MNLLALPRLLVATALLFAAATSDAATMIIPKKSGWRYLDSGSNEGTAWKELAYNDDAWGFGHAELGFGDTIDGRPEATVLSMGPVEDRIITYYFRRFFYVADPAAFTNLLVHVLRDDGAIVYLNGVEVFRTGMPAGEVNFETRASADVNGPDEVRYFLGVLDPSVLVSGINLIAVEVHQVDEDSIDLSFDLELLANQDPDAEQATLLRGPYLQVATTNSIIVKWRTFEETTSRVRFGLAPEQLVFSVLDGSPVADHEVSLTNLAPNTRYYYSVGTSLTPIAGGPDYSFLTAPMLPKPIRIWAIGDCGTATPQARAVFEQYRDLTRGRPTDVWLLLGDNAYGSGTDSEYQHAVFDQYPELLRQTAVWSTMGNHETYSFEPDGVHAYFKIFTMPINGQAGGQPSGTEHYYSFDYGNVHFVCLDSEESDRNPGGAMLTWLEDDLAANEKDWAIAFWHSPPYTKGSHDSDNTFDNYGNMIQMRTNIVPILENYGVDLVLCGHSHDYERSYLVNGHYGFSDSLTPSMILDSGSGQPGDTGPYLKPFPGPSPHQGTVYVVAGSSGWATFQVGRHPIMRTSLLRMGSLVLDVDGKRLDARFVRETGAIDDSFTIIKGGPPAPMRITSLELMEGFVAVTFKSAAGHRYVVEKATRMQHPDWSPASEEITATDATTVWSDIAGPGDDGFYRVIEHR
jgi:hypothetical protein